MSTRRVPIKEVARIAGVSTQTVSRVTNSRPDVSPETRKHVLEVIERLGYRPSRVARAMRGAGRTLGVVGYGLEYYGPSRTLVGVERQSRQSGYGVVLELTSHPTDFDVDLILDKMLSNHVDGIVWCIPDVADNLREISDYAEHADIPIIFTNAPPDPRYAVVEVDNRTGGKLAVEHLIEQGHRTIGLITGPLSYHSARDRKEGWADVLQQHNLDYSESLVVEGDWTAQSGAEVFSALINRRPDMTALFASNDQMALGTFHIARQLGLSIPQDLAVVGYDDIPEAAYLQPPLSSVHQSVVDLGMQAVNELIEMIESKHQQGAFEARNLWIQPELIVRESSVNPSHESARRSK